MMACMKTYRNKEKYRSSLLAWAIGAGIVLFFVILVWITISPVIQYKVLNVPIMTEKTNITEFNISLVLAFIGVIATFIVIGNYSQTNTIREDVKERLNEAKQQQTNFKIETNEKITSQTENTKQEYQREIKNVKDALSERIDQLDTLKEENLKQTNQLEDKTNGISENIKLTKKIVLLYMSIAARNHAHLLQPILNPNVPYKCNVTYKTGDDSQRNDELHVLYENDGVHFYVPHDNEQPRVEQQDITSVLGNEYSKDDASNLRDFYNLYSMITANTSKVETYGEAEEVIPDNLSY